jgi:hypothetical protein
MELPCQKLSDPKTTFRVSTAAAQRTVKKSRSHWINGALKTDAKTTLPKTAATFAAMVEATMFGKSKSEDINAKRNRHQAEIRKAVDAALDAGIDSRTVASWLETLSRREITSPANFPTPTGRRYDGFGRPIESANAFEAQL